MVVHTTTARRLCLLVRDVISGDIPVLVGAWSWNRCSVCRVADGGKRGGGRWRLIGERSMLLRRSSLNLTGLSTFLRRLLGRLLR